MENKTKIKQILTGSYAIKIYAFLNRTERLIIESVNEIGDAYVTQNRIPKVIGKSYPTILKMEHSIADKIIQLESFFAKTPKDRLPSSLDDEQRAFLKLPIVAFLNNGLTIRTYNALRRNMVQYFWHFLQYSHEEIFEMEAIGEKLFADIAKLYKKNGVDITKEYLWDEFKTDRKQYG